MSDAQSKRFLVVTYNKHIPTGVDLLLPPPPEQFVHLEGESKVWNITENAIAPNVDFFAILPTYNYSGVDNTDHPNHVVALQGPGPRTVYWYVVPAIDGPDGARTIAWDHDHDLVWTVKDENNPKSDIVLRPIEPGRSSQWFKLVPIH